MPSREQKRALKDAWRRQEREKLVAAIPLPHDVLRALFEMLDQEVTYPCDRTLRKTVAFLIGRNLEVERIVPWLQQHGGYCDCEVLMNVKSTFGDIIGDNFEDG